jgi:DNA (cytosine-5)-methyltransferase 1
MAENVQGILSLGGGKVVEMIENDFSSVGYEVKRYLLNAADYGVPQNRKRVIFLGISKNIKQNIRTEMFAKFPPFKSASNIHKTLRDAISDLPNPNSKEGKLIPNHVCNNHKVKINGYLGNRKLNWDSPSPTIVGRGGGTGGPVIAVHPNLKRRFSVRETARIQTFPDDFVFSGSLSSQYRQIGNAVAVEFARHLGHSLNEIEKLHTDPVNKLSKRSELEMV